MQLWAPEHVKTLLPTLVVMLGISVLLHVLLKHKSLRVRLIPIQIIAVILVVLEIFKQVISFSIEICRLSRFI